MINLNDWKKQGKYHQYKEHNIFYIDSGRQHLPVLVLLHGFPTASWDWNKIWIPLSGHFRLICIDFLGFGFSDKPPRHQYSIIEQASIVESLLKKKGMTKYHVLAHDYGDSVAQELLARDLEREASLHIQSAILLNGGLFIESTAPRLIQRLLISPIGGLLSPLLSKSTLRRNFKQIFGKQYQPTASEIDDWWGLITHKKGKRVFHLLIRYMAERTQYRTRWVEALQHSKVSIRLIYGPEDPVSGVNIAERYKTLIPDPDVIALEGVGHYPNTERPDLLVHHILAFHDQL
jgi:pimeloyl-ACP methyl ester carboxylesterase